MPAGSTTLENIEDPSKTITDKLQKLALANLAIAKLARVNVALAIVTLANLALVSVALANVASATSL